MTAMYQINEQSTLKSFALFDLGFRPFFSGAGIFSVISMLLWFLMYVYKLPILGAQVNPILWHAHEMIFGYTMAVIAGFLLTAVRNWTGVTTYSGSWLVATLACWVVARLAWYLPMDASLQLAAIADLVFMVLLVVGISLPVIQSRQWMQFGIIAKVTTLLIANMLFYMGALGYLEQGERWGIYIGLYLILALIFVMVRRVLPFFIEKGVDESFKPRNSRWLDMATLVLFVIWAILDIFMSLSPLLVAVSVGLFLLHLWRLVGWYTPGIWQKPLLWSVYVAYGFLTTGFLLKAFSSLHWLPPSVSLHAFTVGGIGLMTLGMMSRVSLGHTGRNVFEPPEVLTLLFSIMVFDVLFRVAIPLVDATHYSQWIGRSQLLWVLSFAIFSLAYVPMLCRPRIDGRLG